MINGAYVNVLDYGADPTGVADSAGAIQDAIDAALAKHNVVFIPAGEYKILSGLIVYDGTQIMGETYYAYTAGFGRDPKGTKLMFGPASSDSLFTYQYDPTPTPTPPTFLFHTSIQNLYCEATNANGLVGLSLNAIIYARFANITFESFTTGVRCEGTINNRFENLFISGCSSRCVYYVGQTETTDVWDQCTFNTSPIAVYIPSESVGIRFDNCVVEDIDNYGFDVSRDASNIIVTNLYAERVPLLATASTPALFRVGYEGVGSAAITNHLTVTGGFFNGMGGASGSVFDVDYCEGVTAGGFFANNFTNVITTTTNTRNNSITLMPYSGISWVNNITNLAKVCGVYPNGVINTGAYNQSAKFANLAATSEISAASGFYNTSADIAWLAGPGTPEGAVTAPVGSLYSRTDGGAGTSLYVKESGAGNTGWVAK